MILLLRLVYDGFSFYHQRRCVSVRSVESQCQGRHRRRGRQGELVLLRGSPPHHHPRRGGGAAAARDGAVRC